MSEENVKQNKTKTKPYLVPGAIIIAGIFIALAIVVNKQEVAPTAPPQTELPTEVRAVTEADHVRGPKNPDLYFIEYADYKCGYCGLFHNTIKQLLEEYDGRVAWVYRHTPYQLGGKEAAVASECIAEQLGEDAFWAYTDAAFEEQRSLTSAWHKEKALELGVNAETYDECIASGKYDELIAGDTANSQELGGQGTPFNVLLTKDGGLVKFSGAQPIENIRIFINRALNSIQ